MWHCISVSKILFSIDLWQGLNQVEILCLKVVSEHLKAISDEWRCFSGKNLPLHRNIKVSGSVSGSTLKISQQKQLARKRMFLLAGAIPSMSGGLVRRDRLSGGGWSQRGAEVRAGWGLVPAQRMGKAPATCTLRVKLTSRGARSQTSCFGRMMLAF